MCVQCIHQCYISFAEPTIWFLSKLVILVYFVNLARKWPNLMQHWQNVEKNVPAYSGVDGRKNRKFYKQITFYTVTISVLIFGKMEELLDVVVKTNSFTQLNIQCPLRPVFIAADCAPIQRTLKPIFIRPFRKFIWSLNIPAAGKSFLPNC